MIAVERAFDLTSPKPVVMAVREVQVQQPSADDQPVALDCFFTTLDEAGDTPCEKFRLASCEGFCDREP